MSRSTFNDPIGMCPECNGLGRMVGVVANDFLDLSKSLNEGAVKVPFLPRHPQPEADGGEVVFQGSYAELLEADTLTGRHLRRTLPIKETVRRPTGKLPICNARANNLQDISVDLAARVLVAITGVAGSGKSSLLDEVFLRLHPDAVVRPVPRPARARGYVTI